MNKYGNIAGYHDPEGTLVTMKVLSTLLSQEVECCSWHNDTCDSLMVKEYGLLVRLPIIINGADSISEGGFLICLMHDYESEDVQVECGDLHQVVEYIKQYKLDSYNKVLGYVLEELDALKVGGERYYVDHAEMSRKEVMRMEACLALGYDWEQDDAALFYFAKATQEEIYMYMINVVLPRLIIDPNDVGY